MKIKKKLKQLFCNHCIEDKQLLLIDLCMRLPHGVICNTPKGNGHLCSINQTIFGTEYGINIKATKRDYCNDRKVYVKPYLRSMEDMTEEEIDEFTQFDVYADGEYVMPNYELIDWLNKNMFDYRGLIPKGLAIEVTEENNPYKE